MEVMVGDGFLLESFSFQIYMEAFCPHTPRHRKGHVFTHFLRERGVGTERLHGNKKSGFPLFFIFVRKCVMGVRSVWAVGVVVVETPIPLSNGKGGMGVCVWRSGRV